MARRPPTSCWNGRRPTLSDNAPDPRSAQHRAGPDGRAPIIVTAQMGAADQAWADRLRQTHFPPERNHLAAHITLFHHLPPGCLNELKAVLRELALDGPPPARIDRLLSLGQGVAFHVHSPALLAMREEIAERFAPLLIPQDRGRPRLHITVQNKVPAEVAHATLALLEEGFRPRPLVIAGLAAWEYRGGPWAPVGRYAFRG